jgi:hypothetical protein
MDTQAAAVEENAKMYPLKILEAERQSGNRETSDSYLARWL